MLHPHAPTKEPHRMFPYSGVISSENKSIQGALVLGDSLNPSIGSGKAPPVRRRMEEMHFVEFQRLP
jgi:hypothetical protein